MRRFVLNGELVACPNTLGMCVHFLDIGSRIFLTSKYLRQNRQKTPMVLYTSKKQFLAGEIKYLKTFMINKTS